MASRELKVEIIGDASSLNKALGSVSKSSSGLGTSLAKMGKLAALGLGALAVGAVAAGKSMVSMASDAAEVDSKMKVVFGKTLPGLTKDLDAFAEATGASRFELREQAADMGALLEPLTATKKGAADMSAQFVKLATDLGSFNNVPVGDALLAIRSGLVGEAEPLRRFGVLLNEGAVKAEAYSSGIAKAGAELTEQQKVQARANLIMEQTTLAQGDAERTAGSMANQFKALKNNLRDAGTEMGMKLLPAVLSVVKAFNENWPQIEKVVDAVMTGLITGAGMAVDAVRTHFNTIKTVVTTAIGGAKTAIEALVNFLRSDFGQQVAIGAASIFALSKAMAGIMAAAKLANTGLLLVKANPLWAALIPLGFALGVVAQKFIENKMEAAKMATTWDEAMNSANRLKDAIDRLKGANIEVRQAQENLYQSEQAMAQARSATTAALVKYGPESDQYTAALHAENQAVINLDRDTLTLQESRARANTELNNQQKGSIAAANALLTLAEGSSKASNSGLQVFEVTKMSREEAEKYAAKARELATSQDTVAQKFRASAPALSEQATKTAELARKLGDLAVQQGRIPTKQEIIATAKLIGGPQFAKAVQGIIDGTTDAQKGAKKQVDKIPGHVSAAIGSAKSIAESESPAIGSAVTSGIESGFDFGGIITIVRQGVQAAIEAGKNAGSTTHDAAKPIGHALVSGPVAGVKEKAPDLEAATKKAVTDAIANTKGLAATAAKSLGGGHVQEIINGIIGKQPSLTQQIVTALREAMAAAKVEAAAKAREIAEAFASAKDAWRSAFGSLLSAGLAAIDAKYKDWQPPSLLKAQREAEEREKAALIKAVTDAQSALQAALAAENAATVAAAVVTRKEGESDEDFEKRKADLVAAAVAAGEALAAAQKTLSDAEFAKRQSDLAALAKIEEDRHNDDVEAEKKKFTKKLKAMMDGGVETEGEAKRLRKQLIKLMADYDIKFFAAAKNWGNSIADGLRAAIKDVEKAADDLAQAVKDRTKKSSPKPRKGPLSTFTMFDAGYELGSDWVKGFTRATDEQNWRDLLATARGAEGIPGVGEISFGGVEGKTGGFELGYTPSWADSEIWASTTRLATQLGKLDEFLQAVGSGSFSSNAGLLEALRMNRTRWNWNDPVFTPRIRRMLEMMYGGMSGREVADYFNLMAKGGIVTRPTLAMIGEAGPEAVIPLKRGMGAKVELHIHGDVLDVDRWAEKMARPIESALARRKSRTGPLAFS